MRLSTGQMVIVFCMLLHPTVSWAQAPAPGDAQTGGRRWDVEGFGGLSLGGLSRGGALDLPLPGSPITTSSPTFPSWSVPSWFFGDGAAFLNNVATEFGISSRLVPLDAALRPRAEHEIGQLLGGVRIRRELNASYSLELAFEISAASNASADDLEQALAAAASSFQTTFAELLTTGPFTAPSVTAVSSAAAGSAREMTLTAALSAPIGPARGAWTAYAVAGGGVIRPAGDPVTGNVNGRYSFTVGGAVPIDETDNLTVRIRQRTAMVGLFGAGINRAMGDRWGVRIDGRVLVGPETTTIDVTAEPTTATATPAGFIESFTYPNLQFSNNPSTGRRSTLGTPGLDRVDVTTGGWQMRGRLTIGIYVKY